MILRCTTQVVSKAFQAFTMEVESAKAFGDKNATATPSDAAATGTKTASTGDGARAEGASSDRDGEDSNDGDDDTALPPSLAPLAIPRNTIIALKVLGSGVYGKVRRPREMRCIQHSNRLFC